MGVKASHFIGLWLYVQWVIRANDKDTTKSLLTPFEFGGKYFYILMS